MNKNLTRAVIAAGLLSIAAPNAQAQGLRQWMHEAKDGVVRLFTREAKPVCGDAAPQPCVQPTPRAAQSNPQRRQPASAPSALDRIADYSMGTSGDFCAPGDQIKLVLPSLTDEQVRAGYTLRYEMAGKPRFSWLADNGAIDGREMRSGSLNENDLKYVQYSRVPVTDDVGTYNIYTLKLPKENFALVLRDKHGRRRSTRNIGATFTARDCEYTAYAGSAEATAEATVTEDAATARAEATVTTATETVTATAEATATAMQETVTATAENGTDGYSLRRRSRRKPLENAGPWEINGGIGSFEHNFQTTTEVRRGSTTVQVPYEESYTGTQLMGQVKYADDNTLFSVQAAWSGGDNGQGSRYYNTVENSVSAFSPDFNFEQTFGHARARVGLGVDASYSSVTFSSGVGLPGPNDDTTLLRDRSVDAYANLIGMIGYEDGSHFKLKAGYGVQRMNFARPNSSSSSDRHSDGVTERMWKAEAGFQLYTINDHLRFFANLRAMAPETQRSTNWKEILQTSHVLNGDGGLEWIFNPSSKNPFGISARAKYGEVDEEFANGAPFNSSDIGVGIYAHKHW